MNAPVAPKRAESILSIAAAELQRAAPNRWGEFITALQSYTDEAVKGVVNAPPDQIFVAQGKAQQMAVLMKLFEEALTTADRLRQPARK